MDLYSNQQNMPRLITLLESLLTSTHQSKVGIEAHSNEAQNLLYGWVLPEHEADTSCQCAESQKQQLVAFLDKVEKAVKYSQSVREGRSDISNPWPDDMNNGISKEEVKKGPPPSKVSSGYSRDKLIKGRPSNGLVKRSSGNSSSSMNKANNYLTEKQEQHSPLCPLYDGFQSGHLRKAKSVPTVGLAEALDVKGIPPELVTVLKSVHQYINRLRTSNAKNRAEATFLRHLNAVNETRWNSVSSCGLFKDLPSLTSGRHYGKISTFNEEKDLLSSQVPQLRLQGSIPFIGIWNPAICSTITVDAFCVQYQNEDIWNLLQTRIQQLQLAHAEWQVCNILSCDPLLSNPDLHLAAAPLFLKAATALSRITALSLPVLVKTCRNQ